MIRELPVDSTRIEFIATGHVTAVQEWVEDGNGGRKLSGNQARDEVTGELLWNIDALGESGRDGEERAEVIGVQVTAPYQPVVTKLRPVTFVNLVARFTKGRDGNLRNYWSAAGIKDVPGAARQTPGGTSPSPGDTKAA